MDIAFPPEMMERIAAEATRRGTTPELVVLDSVRRTLPAPVRPKPPADPNAKPPTNMLEFFGDLVGSVEGNGGDWSTDAGRKFGDDLHQKHLAEQAEYRARKAAKE